jgi:hypothetical protein
MLSVVTECDVVDALVFVKRLETPKACDIMSKAAIRGGPG